MVSEQLKQQNETKILVQRRRNYKGQVSLISPKESLLARADVRCLNPSTTPV